MKLKLLLAIGEFDVSGEIVVETKLIQYKYY